MKQYTVQLTKADNSQPRSAPMTGTPAQFVESLVYMLGANDHENRLDPEDVVIVVSETDDHDDSQFRISTRPLVTVALFVELMRMEIPVEEKQNV